MNTAILNIKTDPETKEQIKNFAQQVGLPVSSLLNAQIKQILRTGKVEFNTNLTPTPYLKSIIKEAESDYRISKELVSTDTDEETLGYLRSL